MSAIRIDNSGYSVICQKYGHFLLEGKQETKNTPDLNLCTHYGGNVENFHPGITEISLSYNEV